jgi:preflagellin peptidase FlaK
VGNSFWILLSALGLTMLVAQLIVDEQRFEYVFVLVPVLLVLADIFLELRVDDRKARYLAILEYAAAVTATVVLALEYGSDQYFQHFLGVPVMMMFIVGLYMMDAIRGGADAKALVSLSILFPFYPVVGSLPFIEAESIDAEIMFPFTFAVLVTAAILVALTPLGFLLTNATKRHFRFPQMFLGYRGDVDKLGNKHFWLMERMVDGRHVHYAKPKREENLADELVKLKAAGHTSVWVTPKIPFIVPILLAVLVCAVVGNPLLLIFNL